jgi:hypothetical protein
VWTWSLNATGIEETGGSVNAGLGCAKNRVQGPGRKRGVEESQRCQRCSCDGNGQQHCLAKHVYLAMDSNRRFRCRHRPHAASAGYVSGVPTPRP